MVTDPTVKLMTIHHMDLTYQFISCNKMAMIIFDNNYSESCQIFL